LKAKGQAGKRDFPIEKPRDDLIKINGLQEFAGVCRRLQEIAGVRTRLHNFTLSWVWQDMLGGTTKPPRRASCLFAWQAMLNEMVLSFDLKISGSPKPGQQIWVCPAMD
tara:strand:- start:40 stop:366 length:327 start_codon:yes stop_codon:yes gene_type:complete